MERPKTLGPLAYVHADAPIERDFPFPDVALERHTAPVSAEAPQGGEPGKLLIYEHEARGMSHLVLVDTPDLDSLEEENRRIARQLALLADAVVFVTSQEKYADEVPSEVLKGVIEDERPVYFLLNKADSGFSAEDAFDLFSGHEVRLPRERGWVVPRLIDLPKRGPL